MIKAVIFDMDGVLINSEPFWQDAEIEVFETIGLKLTNEMCRETMGLRIDHAVDYWLRRHHQLNGQDPAQYQRTDLEKRIVSGVIDRITTRGEAMRGVEEALSLIKSKGVKVALASSSSYDIISAVLEKLNLRERFDAIYSAEEEPLGKPHAGVYLTTAARLEVHATECVAIEDSLNGVIAAKAARMKCIAVPEHESLNDPRFTIADFVLPSLLQIDDGLWARL